MVKYSILFFVFLAVLVLGISSAGLGPFRDPVPDNLKVAHSVHCAGCHGFDPSGQALVDAQGNDVNIFDDWQASMMGLSAHDPFWRATVSHETNAFPAAKSLIESTCLKCHAPLGSIQSQLSGFGYSFEQMLNDSLGLDGVSCSSCHQQPVKGLGKGHSGNFLIDTNRLMFGPYPDPVQGPMQIYVGFDPVFSDHIYSSGICAGCHTLITETLDEAGQPTGNYFVEQATYHEWLNSVYPIQQKECQTCHLPFIKDSVVIATDLLALTKRYPYGLHQFFGANTAMLSMMQEFASELGLPPSSHAAWTESIENNRISLAKAAVVEINSIEISGDTLYLSISIKNKTGHKLPSGYPSRVAWLQVVLKNAITHDTLYANGIMDDGGNIPGRDYPYEPHHEISRNSEDVQIYEMVMSDIHGNLTTKLNAAYDPLKDNRLLPLGFRKTHVVYDTVAIWGNALDDEDYDNGAHLGADHIAYHIPLHGYDGLADLHVSFLYHIFPSRWMQDLFSADSLAFVSQFKSMYEGYKNFTELIDEVVVEDLVLEPSGINNDKRSAAISIFPNPGNADIILVRRDLKMMYDHYQLIDLNGKLIQDGKTADSIKLDSRLPPGMYYFIFSAGSQKLIRPYLRL